MTNRVLRNTAATLDVTFYSDETATDATGSVTVDVVRADGTLLANDAPTYAGAAGDGTYSYTLPPQADLDHLTLHWTGTFSGIAQTVTTHVEIVGGYYFSLAALRAMRGMESTTDFPTSDLEAFRQRVERRIEAYGHDELAFVPRFHREALDGTGCDRLLLSKRHPRRLLKVEHLDDAGVATVQTTTDWRLDDTGTIWRPTGFFPAGTRNIVVAYEYGHDRPPVDLSEAALEAARQLLLDRYSSLSSRAASLDSDFGGTVRFDLIPDERRGRIFGMPDVDAVIRAHVRRLPGIA